MSTRRGTDRQSVQPTVRGRVIDRYEARQGRHSRQHGVAARCALRGQDPASTSLTSTVLPSSSAPPSFVSRCANPAFSSFPFLEIESGTAAFAPPLRLTFDSLVAAALTWTLVSCWFFEYCSISCWKLAKLAILEVRVCPVRLVERVFDGVGALGSASPVSERAWSGGGAMIHVPPPRPVAAGIY